MPGVYLTAVQTEKFKSSCLSVNLLRNLNAQTASQNAMLPSILRRGTQDYPNMEQYAARQDELYGAKITPMVRKKGEVQCIGLQADFVDGTYTPDGEAQLQNVLSLLCDTLLLPVQDGKKFQTDYFDSEQSNLVDKIDALINNKIGYARHAATALMCSHEAYGIHSLGQRDVASNITNEQLYQAWQDVLATSQIEIFYCGTVPRARIEGLLRRKLEALPRSVLEITSTQIVPAAQKTRTHEERMDVGQGNLVLGFRTPLDDFPAAFMANMVYGGSLTGKLFVNVRERLSLCYFAQSVIDKWKGIMFVQAGIDFGQYDKALKEILEQWKKCCDGDITQDEMTAAFNTVETLYTAVEDSPFELEEFALGQAVGGFKYSAGEFIELCRAVTVEQVAQAAQGMSLDTVYFLRGDGS